MDTLGRHLLAEYYGCDSAALNDLERIRSALEAAALEANCTVVECVFHRFRPSGISGVVVIAESHLSIHTWPECGYAAADFYTCGGANPEAAHAVLTRALAPARTEIMSVARGRSEARHSIAIVAHE